MKRQVLGRLGKLQKSARYGLFAIAYIATQTLVLAMPTTTFALSEIAYSGSNISGQVEDIINLPGITLSGDDPTVPVSLSVDGNGILSMTTTTGLTFDGDQTGSSISFSGSITDINNALATLRYRTLDAETVTLRAELSNPGEVFFPGNGHIYEIIDAGGSISWNDAKIAAEALTKNGANGYLATVMSQAEFDYISPRLSGAGWFGASDAATEGDWQWATGPEVGTSFWSGEGDGSPVGGLFSNWSSGEPNNAGDEDCAEFYAGGSGWNDLPCNLPLISYYVVEYGADGDLPTPPDAVEFDITTTLPPTEVEPIGSCLDLISVLSNEAENRYDDLQLTSDIDCTGEDVEPMFSDEDVDFGYIGFRGDFDGQGYEMTNVEIMNVGDNNVGLFGRTDNATIHDLMISGASAGDSCTGGLVGSARNTTFENVTTNVNLMGTYGVGGIVGCYQADADTQSITNSAAQAATSGDSDVGGIAGEVDIEDDADVTFSENDFSGDVDASDYEFGGIIGSAETSGQAVLAIESNGSPGVNVPEAYAGGGIVGYIESGDQSDVIIDANFVTGEVVGYETVGGMVGDAYNDGSSSTITIRDSHMNQNVTADEGDAVGGLVGNMYNATIVSSSFSGGVSVTGADDEVGGLVGEAYESSIEESSSTGNVFGDDSFVGGLVGRNSNTTIEKSYATGSVEGDDRVGGLVGANGGYIIDSYARGNVTGHDAEVGGLAGRCGREITNSYATGAVVDGSSDTGGLIGYDDGCEVENSFWDTETTTQLDSEAGTGKATSEMKTKATFTDIETSEGLDEPWDFSSVWGIQTSINDGYPCLRWQTENCFAADDDDDDGIPSEVENDAPNNGDANNDGTLDSQQAHVSSFVNNQTNTYVVVQLDNACSLTEAATQAEDENTILDSGYSFPAGLVNFAADCGTPGYTTTVTLFQYGMEDDEFTVRKHNPSTNAYFSVTEAVISRITVDDQTVTRAVFSITDGADLDVDGVENGVIVDPVGLGLLGVGAPDTGLGGTFAGAR